MFTLEFWLQFTVLMLVAYLLFGPLGPDPDDHSPYC